MSRTPLKTPNNFLFKDESSLFNTWIFNYKELKMAIEDSPLELNDIYERDIQFVIDNINSEPNDF